MEWIVILSMLVFGAIFLTSSNWARERKATEAADQARADLESVDLSDFPSSLDFGVRFTSSVAELSGYSDDSSFALALGRAAMELHALEGFDTKAPSPPARYDSLEGSKYITALREKRLKLATREPLERFAQKTFEALYSVLLSAPKPSGPGVCFEVTLRSAITNSAQVVQDVVLPFLAPRPAEYPLFDDLRLQLERNVCAASGVWHGEMTRSASKLVFPDRYKGDDVVHTYLRETPLEGIFEAGLDFVIPDASRFEHMHVVAGTGHGKTQTLQHFILHDLQSDAGLVIIDSQGEMLRKIAQLRTDKEVIYLDPTDLAHPPGLNMFDVSRLEGLPPIKREQFLNGLIELLEYVFAGLLRAELTQKQNVLFRYTLRLMLAAPDTTIIDLLKCLADPVPYLRHAASLNPMARAFMEREFVDRSYTQTREQIRRRLYGVLENDAFRRMFSSARNTVDVAAALNRGAVLLVDTAKSHLKSDASALMGRYFIALTLQAALEREGNKRDAFLYIDEAGEYFDDNIDTLLNEARKRRVGIVMAHQYLDQLTPQLRSSIATNTAIKLAGGVSDKDARALASDMRTTPEEIGQQRKGHFVCFVKNVTDKAVSIEVPFGRLEALPKQPKRLAPPPPPADIPPEADLFSEEPTVNERSQRQEARKGEKPEADQGSDRPADIVGEIIPTRDW